MGFRRVRRSGGRLARAYFVPDLPDQSHDGRGAGVLLLRKKTLVLREERLGGGGAGFPVEVVEEILDVALLALFLEEDGEDIVFLRKIVKGGSDKSYGIQVASLAGVPKPVLERASELVEELVDTDILTRAREIASYSGTAVSAGKRVSRPDDVDANQMSLFDTVTDDNVLREIEALDLTRMTPLDAMNTLYRIQSTLKNRV